MRTPPFQLASTLARTTHAGLAADVSRRQPRRRMNAPTDVGGYGSSVVRPSREPLARRSGEQAYLLIEALVYISVIVALLGAGYAAMYRCVDSSIALRRNADDITSALHAGERWRADVRAATNQVRVENTDDGQLLSLEGTRGTVVYRFTTNAVFRSVSGGPWAHVLEHVKASAMARDQRENVTAWRWELEIQPRAYGSVKPGRLRPLFTFLAVPERPATK